MNTDGNHLLPLTNAIKSLPQIRIFLPSHQSRFTPETLPSSGTGSNALSSPPKDPILLEFAFELVTNVSLIPRSILAFSLV
ncbi:unnamed protein product [Microthlaspi erraticum]|uniref:Uncharacterized protein n=1 Tax=Microthlaspi erraticum TaxID=1685480 RepID=A0A6D2K821_9BRAS|nr:unnamed protein product [Microthlaspi erraticum]